MFSRTTTAYDRRTCRGLADVTRGTRAQALGHSRGGSSARTSAFAPDPTPAFGIALVKLVSEESSGDRYGRIGDEPRTRGALEPLSRESNELEPFARALDRYLTTPYAAVVFRVCAPTGRR